MRLDFDSAQGHTVVAPAAGAYAAEDPWLLERVIVAPTTGELRLEPRPEDAAIGNVGQVIDVGEIIGSIRRNRDMVTVVSPHTGVWMGRLADPGERVRRGQPLAWLRLLG